MFIRKPFCEMRKPDKNQDEKTIGGTSLSVRAYRFGDNGVPLHPDCLGKVALRHPGPRWGPDALSSLPEPVGKERHVRSEVSIR